jgi:putative transposase
MSVTVEGHPQRASGTATVGRDWGLETFATVVDAHGKNQPVKNPRFPDQAQRQKLKLLQQALSRKANKRSRNRRQAVSALAREPVRIASRRKDFLHQESGKWVTRCGLLATEPLNVKGMTAHGGAYKTCHACFDL